MKKTIVSALLFYGVLSLPANEKNWIPCEKTYVSLDNLSIHQKGIFVRLGNNWVQTPALIHDSQGIFINSLVQVDGWICEECHYSNFPWHRWCKNPDCVNYGPG